jgi:hypothetical protein
LTRLLAHHKHHPLTAVCFIRRATLSQNTHSPRHDKITVLVSSIRTHAYVHDHPSHEEETVPRLVFLLPWTQKVGQEEDWETRLRSDPSMQSEWYYPMAQIIKVPMLARRSKRSVELAAFVLGWTDVVRSRYAFNPATTCLLLCPRAHLRIAIYLHLVLQWVLHSSISSLNSTWITLVVLCAMLVCAWPFPLIASRISFVKLPLSLGKASRGNVPQHTPDWCSQWMRLFVLASVVTVLKRFDLFSSVSVEISTRTEGRGKRNRRKSPRTRRAARMVRLNLRCVCIT